MPKTEIGCCLATIHSGHQGIVNSLKRARSHFYWHGQSTDVREFVENCSPCQRSQRDSDREPIFVNEIPKLPFELVSTDLFEFKGNDYIVIADSYSGFFDFKKLRTTTSKAIIEQLRNWFSIHGVPRVLKSDNGPQYTSGQFVRFKKEWNFEHVTSSPHFPRSNGFAERHVAVAKSILRKCHHDGAEIQLALLHHRLTPRNDALGTASEQLMGRIIRSNLPIKSSLLKPKVIDNVPNKLSKVRSVQNDFANRKSRQTKTLFEGDSIRIQRSKRDWCGGTIISKHEQPRSYIVKTDDGRIYRRNSHHIRATKAKISPEFNVQLDHIPSEIQRNEIPLQPEPRETESQQRTAIESNEQHYVTRAGRVSRPPARYPY